MAKLESLEDHFGGGSNGGDRTDGTGGAGERAILQLFDGPESVLNAARLRKLEGAKEESERLVRNGVLAASEVARRKKGRTRQIVAWNEGAVAGESEDEARVKEQLNSLRGPLPSSVLLKETGISRGKLARMLKEGKLQSWEEPAVAEVGDDGWEIGFVPPQNVLNTEQEKALEEIRGWLKAGKFTAALLHGVTGSGKTEVYFGAIEAALAKGRQALILVPEIALTLWLGRLMRARSGWEVAVLHSGLPENERSRERRERGGAKHG